MKRVRLAVGYTDSGRKLHDEVEIGKRLLGRDLFAIDTHPLAGLKTNHTCLFLSRAITKFGDLALPVALTVLQSLDSLDYDDLVTAYNELEAEGADKLETMPDNKLRLGDGLNVESVIYDLVEFGVRLTGRDYVEADQKELDGTRRVFYLVGRQVTRLSQSEGEATLSGPLTLEQMETMHVSDLYAMRGASELWRQSFRRPRKTIQEDDGRDGVRVDGSDRAE